MGIGTGFDLALEQSQFLQRLYARAEWAGPFLSMVDELARRTGLDWHRAEWRLGFQVPRNRPELLETPEGCSVIFCDALEASGVVPGVPTAWTRNS